MAIRVRCGCGKVLKAPDAYAGKCGKSPACGAKVPIPELVVPEVVDDELIVPMVVEKPQTTEMVAPESATPGSSQNEGSLRCERCGKQLGFFSLHVRGVQSLCGRCLKVLDRKARHKAELLKPRLENLGLVAWAQELAPNEQIMAAGFGYWREAGATVTEWFGRIGLGGLTGGIGFFLVATLWTPVLVFSTREKVYRVEIGDSTQSLGLFFRHQPVCKFECELPFSPEEAHIDICSAASTQTQPLAGRA